MPKKKIGKRQTKWIKLQNPYNIAEKHWNNKTTKAFNQLCSDMQKSADLEVIQKDYHDLLILLGEWNYLVRECKKMDKKIHKKAKQTPVRKK